MPLSLLLALVTLVHGPSVPTPGIPAQEQATQDALLAELERIEARLEDGDEVGARDLLAAGPLDGHLVELEAMPAEERAVTAARVVLLASLLPESGLLERAGGFLLAALPELPDASASGEDASSPGSDARIGRALLEVGLHAYGQGRDQVAIESLGSASERLLPIDVEAYGQASQVLSYAYMRSGDGATACDLQVERARTLAERRGNAEGEATILRSQTLGLLRQWGAHSHALLVVRDEIAEIRARESVSVGPLAAWLGVEGMQLRESGDFSEALAPLNEALGLLARAEDEAGIDRYTAQALEQRGFCLIELGRDEEARVDLVACLDLLLTGANWTRQREVRVRQGLAICESELGNEARALEQLEFVWKELVEPHETDPVMRIRSRTNIAQALALVGRGAEATEQIDSAIEEFEAMDASAIAPPALAEARWLCLNATVTVASRVGDVGRLARALDDLRVLVGDFFESADPTILRFGVGQLSALRSLERYEEALQVLEGVDEGAIASLDAATRRVFERERLRVLVATGATAEAEGYVEAWILRAEASQDTDELSAAFRQRCFLLARSGRIDEAVRQARALVERNEGAAPGDSNALAEGLSTLVTVLQEARRDIDVVPVARRLLGLRPSISDWETPAVRGRLIVHLAQSLISIGDTEGATRLLDEEWPFLTELAPGERNLTLAAAHYQRGRCADRLGRLSDAADAFAACHAIRVGLLPEFAVDVVDSNLALAVVLGRLGDAGGAREYERRAAAGVEAASASNGEALAHVYELVIGRARAADDWESVERLLPTLATLRNESAITDVEAGCRVRQLDALLATRRGDRATALSVHRGVYAALVASPSPSPAAVLDAARYLANSLGLDGDDEGALELLDEALQQWGPLAGLHAPEALRALELSLALEARRGATASVEPRARSLVDALGSSLDRLALEPAHRASARAALAVECLGTVARHLPGLDRRQDEALEQDALEVLERSRMVSRPGRVARDGATTDDIAELAESVRIAEEALQAILRRDVLGPSGEEDFRSAIVEARLRRDGAERALLSALERAGCSTPGLDLAAAAAALPEDWCAVSYLVDGDDAVARVHAFCVDRSGAVDLLDLGAFEPVREAWSQFRSVVDARHRERLRSATPRGVPGVEERDESPGRPNGRLRELLLDPVLASRPGAAGIAIVPDAFLHSVPFGALPVDDSDDYLADRLAVRVVGALDDLTRAHPRASARSGMLVVGGVVYDVDAEAAAPDDSTGEGRSRARLVAVDPPWGFLEGTVNEARRIAQLYQEASGDAPSLLTGSTASASAFLDACSETAYVHLATHGAFRRPGDDGLGRVLATEAPWLLCGLAFAGANARPAGALESRDFLTASRLASADLEGCELAVLSACETGLGIAESGRGVHSLRSALHSAGVRHTITSLWEVPDEATVELFDAFYRELWRSGVGPHEAMSRAQRSLVEMGYAYDAWAAWVVTGPLGE